MVIVPAVSAEVAAARTKPTAGPPVAVRVAALSQEQHQIAVRGLITVGVRAVRVRGLITVGACSRSACSIPKAVQVAALS